MRKKLTPKFLDSLPPARAKRYEVRDEVLPGLLIRVSSARKKIWYVFVRDGNKNRRVKIGTYPIMSLSDARETGRGVLRDIQLGKFREANEEATEPAFGEVVRQLGVQPHIIEAVLNHRSGIVSGVAAVYNRHAYMNENREALKRWACAIMGEMRNQVTPGARDKMVNGPGISFERQSSQKYPMMN